MTKSQLVVLSCATFLFLGLYLGFDTKPPEQKQVERSRELTAETTDVKTLLKAAQDNISPEQLGEIFILEDGINNSVTKEEKEEAYIALSSAWYKLNYPSIAGFYAEKVAESKETAEAWAIAGSTYSSGIKSEKKQKAKAYCQGRAVKAFENAASLEPENITHRLNLALTHVESAAPMQGIQMLLSLNKKHPENVSILVALGRLALRSNQTQKAVERLENALKLEPNNRNANCLIVQAYEGIGDKEKAETHKKNCESLSNK